MDMNLESWIQYKKIENGAPANTNMVYVPLMSPAGDVLCMDFGHSSISFDNTFFFNRELNYLEKFKNYEWLPKIIKLDLQDKKIFIEWNHETCNNIIESGRLIDEICPDWDVQLVNILNDIYKENVYKINVYPHCFFVSKNKKLKAIDFYACVDHDDYLIPLEIVNPIVGKLSIHRWKEATMDGLVNFKIFFYNGISKHISWPGDILKRWLNEKNLI